MPEQPRNPDPNPTADFPGRTSPDETTDQRAAQPAETTDLPVHAPAREATRDTARRADTSVVPNGPQGTVPYRGDGGTRTFDPNRTSGLDSSEASIHTGAELRSFAGHEILGELGRGGMGVVYKARHVQLDRIVALKMILAGPHANQAAIDRFQAEAKAVARMQHPNIVQIYEVGERDGMPYFSLEFVEGGPLSRKTAREPQPPRYAAELVEKLARAMQYAHDRGIVHRDLKPANVLLAGDSTPKVTDFGLAKKLEADSGQTQSGQVLGTPSYMAPEQATGDIENVGPPADVYALGAILYDLLTGRPPFAGSSVLDTLEMVRTRMPVAPSQFSGQLPKDIETICLKCLQKPREKRYASAGDLADDLRRFLDGRPIVARPVGNVEKAWRWAKRNKVVATLGTAFVSLLIAAVVVTSVLLWQVSIKHDKAVQAQANEQAQREKAEEERDAKERARAAEEAARKVTGEQRRLALDTVRGVLLYTDNAMRNNAALAPVRVQVINSMLANLDRVRDHARKNPLEDRTEAVAYSRIGEVYFRANRVQDAAEWLEKAYHLLAAVAREDPTDPAAVRNLAAISNQLADVEMRLGNGAKARKLYADALKLRQERAKLLGPPGSAPVLEAVEEDVAISFGLIGFADLLNGDPAAAAENYRESDKTLAALPKQRAEMLVVRRTRAEIQVRLGDAAFKLGQPAEAEKHYRAALAQRETLLKLTPKPPAMVTTVLRSDIGLARQALGDFFLMAHRDAAKAAAEYAAAAELYAAILKEEPERLDFRRLVAANQYRLGVVATDPAKAAAAFAECLKLREELAKTDPKDTQAKIEYALALGRAGKAVEAEKQADELLKMGEKDRRILFQTACAFSVAAGGTKDDATAARCKDRAFEVLGSLIAAGWKDRVALETDPDLDAVRPDKRFAELLTKVSK